MVLPDAAAASERGLILLRTHFVDDRIEEMARAFAAGGDYDVWLAIDETAGATESRGLQKMSMTLDSCVRLGLNVAFRKPLWRCGDYVFYHALALNRGYKWYWSIEYDVVINFKDPVDFFRFFDAHASEDYLCACLKLAESDWYWRKMAARRFAVVYHALFPLVRLSSTAADQMLRRRQFETRRMREEDLDSETQWPNDESFVSSAAFETGVKMADFNAYGDYYSENTFAPHLLQHVSEIPPPDNKLYHAVRAGRGYLSTRRSYYKLDMARALACRDAEFAGAEYRDFIADLLAETLKVVPDDPGAVFGPAGPLRDVVPYLEQPDVAEALLHALARGRMRLCLEALQLGRLAISIARTPAFDNMALGRTAWQSSASWRSRSRNPRHDAEGGNDGDTEVEYGFHTGYEDEPWWAVDLAAAYPVRRLRLFNRKLSEQKLRAFIVETSLDFVTWSAVYSHVASNGKILSARPIEIALETPVSARYVRVRLPRRGVLHLAEVEVLTT
jgi:hypothetical protein